jgi:hypothetical protein
MSNPEPESGSFSGKPSIRVKSSSLLQSRQLPLRDVELLFKIEDFRHFQQHGAALLHHDESPVIALHVTSNPCGLPVTSV